MSYVTIQIPCLDGPRGLAAHGLVCSASTFLSAAGSACISSAQGLTLRSISFSLPIELSFEEASMKKIFLATAVTIIFCAGSAKADNVQGCDKEVHTIQPSRNYKECKANMLIMKCSPDIAENWCQQRFPNNRSK